MIMKLIFSFFFFLFLGYQTAFWYSINDFQKWFINLSWWQNQVVFSGAFFLEKLDIKWDSKAIIKDNNLIFGELENNKIENILIKENLNITNSWTWNIAISRAWYFVNNKDVINIKNWNDLNNLIFYMLNNEKTSLILILFIIWWFAIFLFIKTIMVWFKAWILIYKNKFLW